MNMGNANYNMLFSAAALEDKPGEEKRILDLPNSSYAFIIEHISPDSTILDVGCSYGYLDEYLAKNKNSAVYGIEFDEKAVSVVMGRGAFCDVFRINLDRLDTAQREIDRFKNAPQFDYIICGDVLEHLNDINSAFFLLFSRLKPNGKMIVSVPNIAHMDIVVNLLAGRFNYSTRGIMDRTHLRFFTRRSFIEWLNFINMGLSGFQAELEMSSMTTQETPLITTIRDNAPFVYSRILELYEKPDEAMALQYLFILSKKPSKEKINLLEKAPEGSMEKFLRGIRNAFSDGNTAGIIHEKEALIIERDRRIMVLEEEISALRNFKELKSCTGAKRLLKKIFLYKYLMLVKKTVYYTRTYGWRIAFQKVREKMGEMLVRGAIEARWIAMHEPCPKELKMQEAVKFMDEAKISIVTPVYNTDPVILEAMIDSVKKQTYANWELCIVDGGSTTPGVKHILEQAQAGDARIKVRFLGRNKGIAGNSNEALSMATGRYIAFLDHDDLLSPFALYEIISAVNKDGSIDMIYSDEDKISEDGRRRYNLNFKPAWSPDLIRSHNYVTHLLVIRKSIIDNIGGFRDSFDGAQDYDLILRASEKSEKIHRIPKILYHWRSHEKSSSDSPFAKKDAYEAGRRAVEGHLARIGLDSKVEHGAFPGAYKITYRMASQPKISILIPNRDNLAALQRNIDSILNKSTYKDYEIIIVENNSSDKKVFDYYKKLQEKHSFVRVLTWNYDFNYSAINNYAAGNASGKILLFLNNDVEVINPDWLERMAEHAVRAEVGAVGAKLYYPDNTIQHAGVIVGLGGIAGHSHKNYKKDSYGYLGRLALVQNYSAVTAACIMIRREVYEKVGGMDAHYALSFGDVDLCLKIRETGYLIVWTPYAELYHHESMTRGFEDTPQKQARFNAEIKMFRRKWVHIIENGDFYYNPNLTIDTEDFAIRE